VYISSNVSFGFAFATDVGALDCMRLRHLIIVGHCGANEIL
jgi:hypothetical protein